MRDESRRAFLKRMGQLGLAAAASQSLAARRAQGSKNPASTLPILGTRPDTGPIDPSLKSLVVHIQRGEVVDRQSIHTALLREMIEEGIRVVAGTKSAGDAWNRLFQPDDVIGIKFNQVGFTELDSTDVMAGQLIASLGAAGFAPDRIMLIEVPASLTTKTGTRAPVTGFSGGEVSFGTGSDQLATVLQEVTAVINVPFLKTHNIAGMTGALKNLSHALVRRPGRYHDQACAPYVGNIVALPQIRSKLRVSIVNAIRALYAGGPAVKTQGIWNHAGLIMSRDPVAVDAVGTDIINDHRQRHRLPAIGNAAGQVPHVHAAAKLGLGTDDQDYIDLDELAEW
jgi:hypothetical protein